MEKLGLLSEVKITKTLASKELIKGIKCCLTDYAILLGARVNATTYGMTTKKYGSYWTSTTSLREANSNKDYNVMVIEGNTSRYSCASQQQIAVRPTLVTDKSFEEISKYEYPSKAVDFQLGKKLDRLLQDGKLEKTGKTYSRELCKICKSDLNGEKRSYNTTIEQQEEYIFEGKKYVKVRAIPFEENTVLDNGNIINHNTTQWVAVEPVEFIKTQYGYLFKNAIISGLKYDNIENFMNNCMLKDLIPSTEQKIVEAPKYTLESDFGKIIIIDSNVEYRKGTNVVIQLPKEIMDNLTTVTLQASENKEDVKVFYKK